MFLLVRRKFGDGNSVELAMRSAKPYQFFRGHAFNHQRPLTLPAIEHVVQFVGGERLVPKDVARMIGFFVKVFALVSVQDRTTKGDVFRTVSVAAQGHVSARKDKLKLRGPGRPENRDRLAVAESTDVVLELPVPALAPTRIGHAIEDFADQMLLVRRVETALDRWFGNLPVVFESRAQQTAILVHVIPVETDLRPLFFGQ